MIPKGQTHEFWRTIHAGANRAQRDLAARGVHVELTWKGPLREDDREQQVQVVESFATQGMDGIVLAPLDDKALVRPVEEALRLKVPTVIFDSALASDEIVSPIGVYADCGRIGDVALEGDAVVSFTVFVQANGGRATDVQVNAKMRTQAWRRGDSGKLNSEMVYACASTGRWEANLVDNIRRLVDESASTRPPDEPKDDKKVEK